MIVSFNKLTGLLVLLCIFVITVIIVIISWPSQDFMSDKSLKQVHIIFRHGEKLFDFDTSYRNDPYKHLDSFFPYKRGELSLEGRQNAFKLGEQLNKRYRDLIGPIFYSNMVQATTTGLLRTEMTLMIVLASLFPANYNNDLKPGITWQPILFKKIRIEDDDLLGVYYHVHSQIMEGEILEYRNETRKIFDYIMLNSGETKESSIAFVHHTLNLQAKKNLKLPEWTKNIWPEPITTIANDWFKKWFNKYLDKLLGNLISKIILDTKSAINDTEAIDETKFYLYSAHDVNIGSLLTFVNNPIDINKIDYLSCFVFEVHLIDGVYGIKILHQNGVEKDFKLLQIPGYDEFVPLDKFEKFANIRLKV